MKKHFTHWLGSVIFAILGLGVFKSTGLCDACNTTALKYALAALIIAVVVNSFKKGMFQEHR